MFFIKNFFIFENIQIRDMCGYKRDGFPGSQPVSMERDNLRFLAEKKYMVSWKADGIR